MSKETRLDVREVYGIVKDRKEPGQGFSMDYQAMVRDGLYVGDFPPLFADRSHAEAYAAANGGGVVPLRLVLGAEGGGE